MTEQDGSPVQIIMGDVLPRLEEGIENASVGNIIDTETIGTYDVGRTGMTMTCKFCGMLKKELCDCIKMFPKGLAREMANFLPPTGTALVEMEAYLQKIEAKEADTRRRAAQAARRQEENGEESEPVYPCLVCGISPARGHICMGEYMPRSLLLIARNELIATPFQYIGALDTYLPSDPSDGVNLVNTWQQGARQVERFLEEPIVSLLRERSFVEGILCCVRFCVYLYCAEAKEAQESDYWSVKGKRLSKSGSPEPSLQSPLKAKFCCTCFFSWASEKRTNSYMALPETVPVARAYRRCCRISGTGLKIFV